jgi:hypothetical protein
MVQEYLMGGYQSSQKANSWLFGFSSDIFELPASGDFYKANDKDLVSTINPIFSNSQLMVNQSTYKINSGASDAY